MSTQRSGGAVLNTIQLAEIVPSLRFNPAYFEDQFVEMERKLFQVNALPLNRFVPEKHPDGSKGITYGQVGSRKLNPKGLVRYLQVINIRDTGIDFAIKPDRVADNSYNDPVRSRVMQGDILLTNTAFRGTDTLIGRCVVVHRDYGKLNISQDIDRIRVAGVNPYYVGTFLKSNLGRIQMLRRVHGVDSQKINFGQIKSLLIPDVAKSIQNQIEEQYVAMAEFHDQAMGLKENLLQKSGIEPGQYGEEINALANEKPAYKVAMAEAKARLDHLLHEVVAVIERRRTKIRPFKK